MGLGSFAKIFLPKDRVFYELFEQVTVNLVEMGNVLREALHMKEDHTKRDQMLRKLEDLEHKNDEFTHRIFIELGQNFITPFDREDIHYLATSLDDIADFMWGTAKRMHNYNLGEVDDIMSGMSDIIVQCIASLRTGITELRNMKNLKSITDCCVRVNSLENEADNLLDKGIASLFASTTISAVELIKRKDIYEELELVTDKCEDAANVIESIIIKYA